jgi:acyl homoserine lactone synthase
MMQLISADHYAYFLGAVMEMHRLRYRLCRERPDWDVQFNGDMEIDEFDAPEPAYLIQRARDSRVQGCVRHHHAARCFSRSSGPRRSSHLGGQPFCTRSSSDTPKATHGLATATNELFAGMIEFGLSRQLPELVTVSDARMERILRREGWSLRRIGKPRALVQ